ncbi:MAG TPA: hypothetical protein VHO47_02090 [Candidatus Babeliales bacterium]|nr:hypothetical protein [Candidatus Babeliales bacterium]
MQNYFKQPLILIILLPLACQGMNQQQTIKLSLLASHKLGAVQLEKDDKGFHILQNGKKTPVNSYDVDPLLRKMNCDQLKAFQKHGYVTGKKLSNGEYTIKAHVRGKGGGIGGASAGFYLGKFSVYFVGHGAILIAAACTGPAFPVTFKALELTLSPAIEAASNTVAIGCGVIGGTATGPV